MPSSPHSSIPTPLTVAPIEDCIQTAGDLCRETVFVEDTALNKTIFDLFEARPELQNIPVLADQEIAGLINRDKFMRSMARRFHWELYANKRCTKMMDAAPVTVEAETPISQVANELLKTSHKNSLSDGFVVKRGHELVGTGLTSDVLAALLFSQRILSEQLVHANLKLLELSITDPLTGLHNRRHFDEILPHELRRVQRENQHLCLMMVDIDFFKKLNDHYGHQAGDEALRRVAQTLRAALHRPTDYCFRLGGEEFGILCSGDSPENIGLFAETLRQSIADLGIPHANHPLGIVTISIGLAFSTPTTAISDAPHQLYEMADLALYDAKNSGRNQVRMQAQISEGPDHGP